MNDLMEKNGKRLPYGETDQYVDSLVERCTINAIASTKMKGRKFTGRLWWTASVAAALAIVLTTVINLHSPAIEESAASTPAMQISRVECDAESVEQSVPLNVALTQITDDQLASVAYYSTDDIPEY